MKEHSKNNTIKLQKLIMCAKSLIQATQAISPHQQQQHINELMIAGEYGLAVEAIAEYFIENEVLFPNTAAQFLKTSLELIDRRDLLPLIEIDTGTEPRLSQRDPGTPINDSGHEPILNSQSPRS